VIGTVFRDHFIILNWPWSKDTTKLSHFETNIYQH